MIRKSRNLFLAALTAFLFWIFLAPSAFAHSIDYVATDIQPQAIFSGHSGHFKLIDPITPGQTITFNLTFELIESVGGPTSALPVTVTFGVQNTGGPEKPVVKFGSPATDLTDTVVHTYEKTSNKIASLMTTVTAWAPSTPGSYHFKIQAIDGFKGNGFTPGDGIVVHFTVVSGEPEQTELTLTLESPGILYRTPSNIFTATLKTAAGAPLSGQDIYFYVNDTRFGPVTTDGFGVASVGYSTGDLKPGDHLIAANYEGSGSYASSSDSATQCVTYKWLGFLPPVLVQDTATSGLGIGLFQGKVIPVKIKIADYYGSPVANAEARVYFANTVAGAVESQAVAIQPDIADTGSLMRYDPVADQYILNWNISKLTNGDYNIRVGLDEGGCAVGHWSPVRIGKATK